MTVVLALAALICAKGGAQDGAQAAPSAHALRVVQEIALAPETADVWIGDLHGDGRADLLAIGSDAVLSSWSGTDAEPPLVPTASARLQLADPARSLLDPVELDPETSGLELLALGPDGAYLHRLGAGAAENVARELLAARARFALRAGAPRFAPIGRDWSGDGRADLYVPGARSAELWLARPAPQTGFARALRLPLSATLLRSRPDEDLAGVRSERVIVPPPQTRDQNGDGRADLEVSNAGRRRWYLQRADGTFSAEADAVLDVGSFRDTTPPAELAPGRTLVASDDAVLERRDLDGDGIDDSLLAHGRKVWVFPGGSSGPQFREPSQILRSAEDLSAVATVEIDRDGRPDLVLVKVEVPSFTSLLLGMVSEWRIHVRCAGYPNRDGRSFETTPRWRSELALVLPPLTEILRSPEKLLERFEGIGDALRVAREADMDGDGVLDLVLLDPRASQLGVWLGRRADEGLFGDPDEILREALFEGDPDWTLERVVAFLRRLGERRAERLTGGTPADALLDLGERAKGREFDVRVADFDGDGRAELALIDRVAAGTRAPRGLRVIGLE